MSHQNESNSCSENQLNQLSEEIAIEKNKNQQLCNKLYLNIRRTNTLQKQNEKKCTQIINEANEKSKECFEEMAQNLLIENARLKNELEKYINTSNNEGTQTLEKNDEDWRKKVEALEAQLNIAKIELKKSNIDRRNLLHNLLELKGKVRIVCRLRPILEGSEEKIDYKINQYRKLTGNISILFHIKSILTHLFS